MKNGGRSARKGRDGSVKKSAVTRGRIIAAARKVFSRHPYHTASVRMIGKEGGFNHELIRYHFPSKAGLFECIIRDICDDVYRSNISFLDGTAGMAPERGLSIYLDRFLDYHYRQPDALRIIMMNMTVTDDPESIPGYRHIPDMLARTRLTFREKIPLAASDEDVERFLHSFNNLLIHLLGAGYCQANILGMKHTGKKYREWVKKTLLEIFLPHLIRLIGRGRTQ